MNTSFNETANISVKRQAEQLIVELKNLTPNQRQSLLNIYQALDRVESTNNQQLQSIQHNFDDDQYNQEDQYVLSEDFPQGWVRRVNQTRSK